MAIQPNQSELNLKEINMKPKGSKNVATLQKEIDDLKAKLNSGIPATPVAPEDTTSPLSNPTWVKGYNGSEITFTAPIGSLQLTGTQGRESAKLTSLDKKFDTVIYLTDNLGNSYYTFGIFACDSGNGFGIPVSEYLETNKESFFKP